MKRITFITIMALLCVSLLSGCQSTAGTGTTPTAAPTQEASMEPSTEPSTEPSLEPVGLAQAVSFDPDAPYVGDINGDGQQETLSIELYNTIDTGASVAPEATAEASATPETTPETSTEPETSPAASEPVVENPMAKLIVTAADGTAAEFETDANFLNSAYVADLLPGDGVYEILFSVSQFSDDNMLWIFHYENGQLVQVVSREGSIEAVDGQNLTVNQRVDCFGTWGANIVYTLDAATNTLVAAPDQIYQPVNAMQPVKAAKEIACELKGADGTFTASTIAVGDSITMTGTDLVSYVFFTTADGTEGRIAVTFSAETNMPLIDGVNDYDCFENLPYAD